MRRLTMALGVMAAVLLVAGVSAQKSHNFTGMWTVDADKSGPAPAAGGRGGGAASDFEIRMDDKTMNVITTRGGNSTTNSYKLDGTDSKNTSRGGEEVTVAKWDGDKLVLTNKTNNQVTSYWMDGADLVRSVTRPGQNGGAAQTTQTYFKKKS